MKEYPKIQTLFKRDNNNIIIPSKFTLPEFEYLKDCKWECTEKIDGTNMRIELDVLSEGIFVMSFGGRTSKANIPIHLEVKMHDLFDGSDWNNIFPKPKAGDHITIYGEGYGIKIQDGGNYISNDVNFILFDVLYNNTWLSRESCLDIAEKLGIMIVPLVGYMTIPEAIEYVKKGFKSFIAENKNYDAEGLVVKTPVGLKLRNGDRIITKIKTCDFRKFKAKYGDEENPTQSINEKYKE